MSLDLDKGQKMLVNRAYFRVWCLSFGFIVIFLNILACAKVGLKENNLGLPKAVAITHFDEGADFLLSDVLTNREWQDELRSEFSKPYFASLESFLRQEISQGKTILPALPSVFAALNKTPLSSVKVVILGQDPYPTPGNAHGLAFSVLPGVAIPASLNNIYQELASDLNISPASHGNLEAWANQGVLLLNAVLTVEAYKPNAHKDKGWEQLTDKIIDLLNNQDRPIVYLLWGKYAQKKGSRLNNPKHLKLLAGHPSPLSAKAFLGCRHFSQTNDFLIQHDILPINWHLPDR